MRTNAIRLLGSVLIAGCGLFMGSQGTLGSGVMQSPRGPSWAGSLHCEGPPSQVRVLFRFVLVE